MGGHLLAAFVLFPDRLACALSFTNIRSRAANASYVCCGQSSRHHVQLPRALRSSLLPCSCNQTASNPPPLVASHVRHGGRKKLTVPQKSRRGTPSSMVRRSSRSVMAAQWGTGKMPGGGVKTERSCSPHATSARCRACHGAASHLTLHPPPPITALCTHSRQMLLAHAEAEQPDRFRQRVKALAREHSLP